jgi:HTH-type transcriptional regulator, competence development regulator
MSVRDGEDDSSGAAPDDRLSGASNPPASPHRRSQRRLVDLFPQHDYRLTMTVAEFGQHLRDLRKRAGLSQRDLAQRAGIDFTYLSKIENGRVDPPGEDTMRALAMALGAEAEDLLARARKMPRDLKRLVAQGSPQKALLLRRIARTPMSEDRVERMLRMLDEETSTK